MRRWPPPQEQNDSSGNANWDAEGDIKLTEFVPCVDPCIISMSLLFLGDLGLFTNALPSNNQPYCYTNTLVDGFQDCVIASAGALGNPLSTWFTERRWLVTLELLLMPPNIFLSTLKESGIIL